MKKNIFDKMTDSYDNFHLRESELKMGNETLYISPKLKLTLGWSFLALCCVLVYVFMGDAIIPKKMNRMEEKKAVLDEKIDTSKEHDTIVPYQKDADKDLNTFIESYFKAIVDCDYTALQDMVTNGSEYSNDVALKKKAEFIKGYDNITVYTKEGLDEYSYVVFAVANVTIAGVNSSPYDIITLYVVNGARGYLVNNGTLSDDAVEYIEKIKGDADIQKVYRSIEKKNAELKKKDPSLQEFYDMLSQKNAETNVTEKQGTTEAKSEENEGAATTESPQQKDNETGNQDAEEGGEEQNAENQE
ncbi:MAG: hypothetical protein K2I10_04645 [Lachnospiraceae bacterium]|nr:hypothetical protein [Lachnospiraceae bacterium]